MNTSVDKLNSFLRGEISAVETYRQAIDRLGSSPQVNTLIGCLRSHEQRVELLEHEIRRLGGEPAQGSGPWGAFARLIQSGSNLLGEKAAIAALEEGEDHGKNDYQRDVPALDGEAHDFAQKYLLPEQQRTHQAMSALKHLTQ